MILAQANPDEVRRLAALRQYNVLDTLPEQALDDLTSLAAAICGTPIAMISLVDEHRQWFKSKVGTTIAETARDISFCGHAIQQRDLFIVPDATRDERFADNPLVTGDPEIRFYAGAPLVNGDDSALGALCVIDHVPRVLTQQQEQALRVLGRQVMAQLGLRRQTRELVESESKFRMLAENITDVFWITSVDLDQVHYVSPGYELIWGRTAKDLYANPHQWFDAILPDDRQRVFDCFAPLMKHAPSVSVDYRIVRPDGGIRWIQDRGFQVRDATGQLVRLTGIAVDITGRNQADIASLRLAAIVEFSDDAIIGKDLDGIVTSWNKGAEKVFGYTAGEMVGTSIMRLIPPDRQHEESLILGKIRSGESVEHFETLRLTKDGRSIDISVTASPIKDATGKPIGVSKVARDISGRKLTEKALHKERDFISKVVDTVGSLVVVLDRQARIVRFNRACERLTGYSFDEVHGRNLIDLLIMPEEKATTTEEFGNLCAGQFPNTYENHWVTREGVPRVMRWSNTALVDAKGEVEFVIGTGTDVTERKQAEKKIAEQAALLDKARDAILVRDLEGNILYWNSGAERIYGWTRQEVVGRYIGALLYTDRKKFEEVNAQTISQGEWHGELQHLTKGRHAITVEARWTLIRDDQGKPKSVLAINTDITEKKKLETQFMRAQRMESIGTLAGGVAHDLNNILAPIMMSIDILKNMSPDPQAKDILETIEVSARRGADIVRQVLSFARGLEGERIEVQPKHLLKDLEHIIKDTFPKHIRLSFSTPNDTWTILGDPTQVHQILLNLCVNARDAMPHGGALNIGVENCVLDEQYAAMNIQAKPGRYVVISVTDSGMGIPQNILDKIFEPFFTTKELSKGTGLGLSTVMAIVKSHEGIVNVYSEPGRGTTFKVYLPATETFAEAQTERREVASLPRGNGETILVVDDEASILNITSQTLQAFGYRALTATNGAIAVGMYADRKQEIAVVLTDMMMPIMDGSATIHALLQINPAVKIVAASGLKANAGEATMASVGVKHFLTKPYTAGTLLKTIRQILTEA